MANDAPVTDLVTQVQDNLNDLCALFFNMIGCLQRDAAPAAVSDERPPDPPPNSQKHDVKSFATQIAQASKQLDELIGQLPVLDKSEPRHIEDVSRLKVGDWLLVALCNSQVSSGVLATLVGGR